MSRIGRLPVIIPESVQVDINGSVVRVKGPKGELVRTFLPEMGIKLEDNQVLVGTNSGLLLDYSGGQTTNFGAHSNDIAQWGMGTDGTGPARVW